MFVCPFSDHYINTFETYYTVVHTSMALMVMEQTRMANKRAASHRATALNKRTPEIYRTISYQFYCCACEWIWISARIIRFGLKDDDDNDDDGCEWLWLWHGIHKWLTGFSFGSSFFCRLLHGFAIPAAWLWFQEVAKDDWIIPIFMGHLLMFHWFCETEVMGARRPDAYKSIQSCIDSVLSNIFFFICCRAKRCEKLRNAKKICCRKCFSFSSWFCFSSSSFEWKRHVQFGCTVIALRELES